MEYVLIPVAAFVISGLTLFSGFGLGTVLMPVFALFFAVPVAIASTAVVHLANNVFKVFLVGRAADWRMVLRFSVPAAVAAVAGASALVLFSDLPPLAVYELAGEDHAITPVKAVIGVLIVVFAALELHPRLKDFSMPPRYVLLGGALSGFFGGLSGNQGAFRSAFLIKAGLDKDAFVGTSVISAVIVDTVRLAVYGLAFYTAKLGFLDASVGGPVVAAMIAAFLGAFLGARLLEKVTLRFVQVTVGIAMGAVGTGLASGLI